MDYTQATRYLNALEKFGIHLGLERIGHMLNSTGNPQKKFRAIHVAGTNGKGSVCRMLGSILKEAGLLTGVYTSPHLQDFSERITIDNKKIPKKDIARLATKLAKTAEKLQPTQFELTTALAFQYFAEKKIDIAVVETGMGGRLDATNTILPELSIITNVELEHMEHLGSTIQKIAREKAGIIKPNVPAVTACAGEALGTLKKVCEEKDAQLHIIENPEDVLSKYPTLKIPLLGAHQRINAAIAIKAAELLGIPKEAIIRGIRKTKHPGRLERMQTNPPVLLDGAHNPAGMSALAKAIRELNYKKLILVLAVSKDKDVKEMASALPPADIIIASQYGQPRSMRAEALAGILAKSRQEKIPTEATLRKAVKKALSFAGKKGIVLVTGSLYAVGEARKMWKKTVEYE